MKHPITFAADCGGSHCRVRLYGENGRVLGHGKSGPSNINLGAEQTLKQLSMAAEAALNDAKISAPLSKFTLGAGIAGLVNSENIDALRKVAHPFKKLIAASDAYTAFLGAVGAKDGAVVILGTGSCGYGQINNKTFSIGGWGPHISDQASSARVGILAVRRTLQALDFMSPSSALTQKISTLIGPAPEDIYLWSKTAKPFDFGQLAPLVFEMANDENDQVALNIISIIAGEAEQLIQSLLDRGCRRVAIVGGLSTPLLKYLNTTIKAKLKPAENDALSGAYKMVTQCRGFIEIDGSS